MHLFARKEWSLVDTRNVVSGLVFDNLDLSRDSHSKRFRINSDSFHLNAEGLVQLRLELVYHPFLKSLVTGAPDESPTDPLSQSLASHNNSKTERLSAENDIHLHVAR